MRTQPTAVAMRSALKTLFTTLAAICSVCCFQVTAAQARSVTYNLDIPAQDLNAALQQLALASQHKLFYKSELVEGKTSAAIRGEFTTEQALKTLLEGTNLTYDITPSAVVLIRDKQSVSMREATGSGANSPSNGPKTADTLLPVRGEGTGMRVAEATGDKSKRESKGFWKRLRLAQAEGDDKNKGMQKVQDENSSDSAKAEDENKLSEIIVTAQKREESLKDVPISVSVLSGEDLDSSSFSGVTDALRTIPGVSINVDQNGGGGGGAFVSARGVSNGIRYTGPGPIAYYIDGTPFGFVRSPHYPADPNIYDLERIEFLAGPQGTLYGANALNGVLRVLTHNADPTAFEFKSRASLSTTRDGGQNYGGDVAVNVPLVQGKLAARAVVGYQNNDGWIDSRTAEDINSQEDKNYRLKLHARPSDTLSVDLSVWRSESEREAPSNALDDGTVTATHPQPGFDEFDVYGVEINKEFSKLSMSSTTSYIDYSNAQVIDAEGPTTINGELQSLWESTIFSQEINLTSNLEGPWRWSAGAFYRDAKDLTYSVLDRHAPDPRVSINNNFDDTSESKAVYGEIGRRFLDDELEFSLGLRYFEDKQTTELNQQYLTVGGAPFLLPPYSSESDAVTPRAALTWKPTTDRTVYASYSQGFRSGLGQVPNVRAVAPQLPPAEPDKLTNYEVGSKGSMFGGRLAYTAAVFYIDWQDIQQNVRLSVPVSPTQNLVTQGIINGESASGVGAEFAITARPVEGLELSVNASWNDLRFDADVMSSTTAGVPILIAREGARLTLSPEYTVGGSGAYSFPLGGGGITGRLSLSGNYTSVQLSRTATGVELFGEPMFIGSARFDIETGGPWSAALYADNVTNEDRSATAGDVPEWFTRIRPRTIGLQLEYRY